MTDFELNRELVDAFVNGRLDDSGEARLAEQVARIIPYHWTLPHPMVAQLKRVVDHLGGQPAVLTWLESHPGRPRLVARMYALIGLLDELTDKPAVLTALRELRANTPYPQGLAGYLTPDTDRETLSSLAEAVELLLADDRPDEAVRVADAAAAMLQQIAPRFSELAPELGETGAVLERIRKDIRAAADGDRPDGA